MRLRAHGPSSPFILTMYHRVQLQHHASITSPSHCISTSQAAPDVACCLSGLLCSCTDAARLSRPLSRFRCLFKQWFLQWLLNAIKRPKPLLIGSSVLQASVRPPFPHCLKNPHFWSTKNGRSLIPSNGCSPKPQQHCCTRPVIVVELSVRGYCCLLRWVLYHGICLLFNISLLWCIPSYESFWVTVKHQSC